MTDDIVAAFFADVVAVTGLVVAVVIAVVVVVVDGGGGGVVVAVVVIVVVDFADIIAVVDVAFNVCGLQYSYFFYVVNIFVDHEITRFSVYIFDNLFKSVSNSRLYEIISVIALMKISHW